MAGPLTVGEAAGHLSRAQSVVSDIVSHLERQGLLERESDPADRRRTLVWLTAAGHEALRRDREVLSVDLLARRWPGSPAGQADALIAGPARPGRPGRHGPTTAKEDLMTTTATCESCGMPLETGRYCDYCTDEHGELQAFDERFARMVDWQARRSPGTAAPTWSARPWTTWPPCPPGATTRGSRAAAARG